MNSNQKINKTLKLIKAWWLYKISSKNFYMAGAFFLFIFSTYFVLFDSWLSSLKFHYALTLPLLLFICSGTFLWLKETKSCAFREKEKNSKQKLQFAQDDWTAIDQRKELEKAIKKLPNKMAHMSGSIKVKAEVKAEVKARMNKVNKI